VRSPYLELGALRLADMHGPAVTGLGAQVTVEAELGARFPGGPRVVVGQGIRLRIQGAGRLAAGDDKTDEAIRGR
jgi:hypothetical protein